MSTSARKLTSVRNARDFFGELMAESQEGRAHVLAERERWLRGLTVEGREELLFEFEMLVRGVERYFNLHNLPLEETDAPLVTRDFSEELRDVRETLEQAISIARQLLAPEADQKLVFRKYIESRLADDRQRRAMLEDFVGQDSPEESLFLIRQSFEAQRTIVDHLLKLEPVQLSLYNDIGNLALREIVLNRYFRPFRPLEFRIEYDRVKSVPILELLRNEPPLERRMCTVAFLGLFRLLHYLSYVSSEDGEGEASDRRGRIILALVRSETTSLSNWLESDVAPKTSSKRVQAVAVKISRELSRQSQGIVKAVLSADGRTQNASLEAAVSLTSVLRKQVVLLARTLARVPEAAFTFEALSSASVLAQRLRLDLYGFKELLREVATDIVTDEADAALERLQTFQAYFHDVSYQLLRYADYEPFDRFSAMVCELDGAPVGLAQRERFADDCRLFAQVVETTWTQVNRRAVLTGHKFDATAARAALTQVAKLR